MRLRDDSKFAMIVKRFGRENMNWNRCVITLGFITVLGFCANSVIAQIIIDGDMSDWENVAQFDMAPNPEEYVGDFLHASGDIEDIYITHNQDSLFIRIDINSDGNINELEADSSLIQIGFDTDNSVVTGLNWGWWLTGVDYFANITWPNDGCHPDTTLDSLGIIRFIGTSNTDSAWEDTYYGCQTAASPDGISYEIALPLAALGDLSESLTIMFITEETVNGTNDTYPDSLGGETAIYNFTETANPTSLTVSEVLGSPDQYIIVPLSVEFTPGSIYSSVEMSIHGFQGELEFLDIILSGGLMGLAGWSYQVNETDSLLHLAFAGANEIYGEGQLFQLAFHIPGDAEPGFVPITINSILFDNAGIPDSIINGGVEIIPSGYIVTNTDDNGPGSLRQYILEANLNPGLDTIKFDIPGPGPHTIQLFSALPTITDAIVIDGTTEPDFSGSPVIELDGSNAGEANGLRIISGNSTVKGLVINRFAHAGINLWLNGGNIIQNNIIGLDITGTIDLGNNGNGIDIHSSSNNLIGSEGASPSNVISGNESQGVDFYGAASEGNLVIGNYIGLDLTGSIDVGNTGNGIHLYSAPGNTISGNVISGNNATGIVLFDQSSNNIIQGNFIGLDASGNIDLGNTWAGIDINDESTFTTIGGTNADQGNLISGNGENGINLGTNHNTVQGNIIGLNILGTEAIGNGDGSGISIGGCFNVIGGLDPGDRNIISGNSGPGIEFCCEIVANNEVLGNYIGTDVTGAIALGNGAGINILSAVNIIGGDEPGAGNLISGNEGNGIDIGASGWPTATYSNTIKGNYIGTDLTGTIALPNGGTGILISESESNLIGGVEPGASNLISGNGDSGLSVNSNSHSNVIRGNFIGTDISGTEVLGNDGNGIFMGTGSRNNLLGGIEEGAGNVIANNEFAGIVIGIRPYPTGTVVSGNSIYNNGALGIDLSTNTNYPWTDGITSNDPGDADFGPNYLQNFPELLNVGVDDGGDLLIQYLVDSNVGNSEYPIVVEFFLSDEDGEGQLFLYSNFYTAANHEQGLKTIFLGPAINYGLEMGDYIVATATDAAGNTSEFSAMSELGDYVYIDDILEIPDSYVLEQNLPNPFNPTTTISYGLPESSDVSLVIYDLKGRVVQSYTEQDRPAGWVHYEWNGTNANGELVSTGVYLCRLEAGKYSKTIKMVFMK
jgi:parallel beta-helix repeat protein